MLLHFAKQYVKIQTLCFAIYFGQPLKICGATHIFLTFLFKSPSQSFGARRDFPLVFLQPFFLNLLFGCKNPSVITKTIINRFSLFEVVLSSNLVINFSTTKQNPNRKIGLGFAWRHAV